MGVPCGQPGHMRYQGPDIRDSRMSGTKPQTAVVEAPALAENVGSHRVHICTMIYGIKCVNYNNKKIYRIKHNLLKHQ